MDVLYVIVKGKFLIIIWLELFYYFLKEFFNKVNIMVEIVN